MTTSVCRGRCEERAVSAAISRTRSEEETMARRAGAGGVEGVSPWKPALSAANQHGPAHEGLVLPPAVAIPQRSFWSVNAFIFLSRMKILTLKSFFFFNPFPSMSSVVFSNQFLFPLLHYLFPAQKPKSIRGRHLAWKISVWITDV